MFLRDTNGDEVFRQGKNQAIEKIKSIVIRFNYVVTQ